MDPRWLFPLLGGAFLVAACVRGLRTGRWRGGAATWLLLGFIFIAVSLWLNRAA